MQGDGVLTTSTIKPCGNRPHIPKKKNGTRSKGANRMTPNSEDGKIMVFKALR
jgi:hypothetical protein